MKRKKLQQPGNCRLCTAWHECPSNRRFRNGTRQCYKNADIVVSSQPACFNFALSDNFWCEKNDKWSSPGICLKRFAGIIPEKTKTSLIKMGFKISGIDSDCKRCKDGEVILSLHNQPKITFKDEK